MTDFELKAKAAGVVVEDLGDKVPYLSSEETKGFVSAHGGVKAVFASFAETDTFWFAGLRPHQLEWKRHFGPTPMMIRTQDDSLVAVTGVNVGYAGTGPDYARSMLVSLGLDERLAGEIAYSRVSNVNLESPENSIVTFRWPYVNLPIPKPYEGKWIVRFDEAELGIPETPDPSDEEAAELSIKGFYGTKHGTSMFRNWIRLLDDPSRPDWLQGPRTVDVYTSIEACQENGMVIDHSRSFDVGGVYRSGCVRAKSRPGFPTHRPVWAHLSRLIHLAPRPGKCWSQWASMNSR